MINRFLEGKRLLKKKTTQLRAELEVGIDYIGAKGNKIDEKTIRSCSRSTVATEGTLNDAPSAIAKHTNSHDIIVGPEVDSDVLALLPDDIRNEVIQQERRQLQGEHFQHENDETLYNSGSGFIKASSPRRARTRQKSHIPHEIYDGDFDVLGQRHGKGAIRCDNGDTFGGMFRNGLRNGMGTLKRSTGSYYTGGWKSDRFNGHGIRRFKSGCTYTGNFRSGLFYGQGKCDFPNGDSFSGEWKDGLMDGSGSYSHANGDVYEGMFHNNKPHGPGQYRAKDGTTYVTRHKEGSRIGFGVQWSRNKKKAWIMKGKDKVKKISVREAKLMENKVLSDLNNEFADNLEYHIRS